MTDTATVTKTETAISMQLASKESNEHMVGMEDVYQEFRNRPMILRVHDVDIPLPATANVKTIHFIRHGQGFHNLLADIAIANGTTWQQFDNTPNSNNPYIRTEVFDAPLTEVGRQQAQRLHETITANSIPIDRIYVSPHCRTLQTGMIAFQHCVNDPLMDETNGSTTGRSDTKIELVAHELLREESGIHVCDQRRTISWQRIEFPQYNFHDYCTSNIDPLFQSNIRETKLQVADRIYDFLEFVSKLDTNHTHNNNNIAVVSHSGWLHTLFNAIVQDDDSYNPKYKQWFNTGEMRSVQLEFIQSKKDTTDL